MVRKFYKAIKHDDGDIIETRDCILVCSGSKKDNPYVAKVTSFWEEPNTGNKILFGECVNFQGSSTAILRFLPPFLTHFILVDSSTVICWMSLFVILGVSGLFCCFYSIFDGKSC